MTNTTPIQPHNERPAAVWSSGGAGYDQISRGIADSIEHCVLRLNPQRGERILDLATGTGWTSRLVARRGAKVTGADIAGDLLGAARERPGALNIGTTTVGSTNHLAANLLKSMTGLSIVIVPFRTPGDLLTAVLRNDVDAIIQSYGALKSAVESNQIRALGITTPKRTAYAPDVPTVDEAGVTGFDVVTWNGAFAPTGTPPEVIGTLNREMRGALSDPELVQRYTELGLEPLPTTPNELSGRLRAEIGKWGRVIRDAGIEQQ